MKTATFRFYAELSDFLAPERRGIAFAHYFSGRPSVKDTIESLGVPHGEVDLVLLNSESVDFSAGLSDGDRVSVYPVFESIDIGSIARVRPEPLREPRFILDVHLGRLAAYLRLFGFDTLWRNRADDAELAQISSAEGRILLTRDRDLLKRSNVTHGAWLRETRPQQQLSEVLLRFDLFRSISPFRLCLRCNHPLEVVSKAEIIDRLPPRIRALHREFKICPLCERIYWKGSHHERMKQLVAQTLRQSSVRDTS